MPGVGGKGVPFMYQEDVMEDQALAPGLIE